MAKTKKKNRTPFLHRDKGIIGAVGLIEWVVYEVVRGMTGLRGVPQRVLDLRNRGKIVARVDHGYVARTVGISPRRVGIALKRLEEVGWIKAHKLGGNKRAYQVGWFAKRNVFGKMAEPRFHADRMVKKVIDRVNAREPRPRAWSPDYTIAVREEFDL